MSIFAFPTKMMPGVKTMEEMGDEMMAMMPRQFGPAANLAAYPAGAAAAMSALGLAAMGQMYGLMFGTLAGAVDASRRMGTVMGLPDPAEVDWPSALAAWQTFEDAGPSAADMAEPKAEPAAVETVIPVAAAVSGAPVAESAPAAPILPEDFHAPLSLEKPEAPDDLKMISGIGPKLEQVLNAKGVWTFAQIAAWTAPEVAWVDDSLALRGRIERDDWLAQAAALARGGREEYVKVFGKEPK